MLINEWSLVCIQPNVFDYSIKLPKKISLFPYKLTLTLNITKAVKKHLAYFEFCYLVARNQSMKKTWIIHYICPSMFGNNFINNNLLLKLVLGYRGKAINCSRIFSVKEVSSGGLLVLE